MNHKSLHDAVAFIEEIGDEKLTPDEIEEVRQALNLDEQLRGAPER